MASRQLAETERATAAREADVATAAEIAQEFPGWRIWSARTGTARLATRTGGQRAPADDTVFAKTLIESNWDDLKKQLAVQSQHDAELTYQ